MEDVFVSNIHINKVRHLENLDIPLSTSERKHLILTGKNGSGKTSLLITLKDLITATGHRRSQNLTSVFFRLLEGIKELDARPVTEDSVELLRRSVQRKDLEERINKAKAQIPIFIDFGSNTDFFNIFELGSFVFAFFGVNRISQFEEPSGPSKLEIKYAYGLDEKANTSFMQHMANLRFNYLNAVVSQDNKTAQAIDEWMDRFESCLCEIFEDPELKLNFDSENFKYIISSQGKKFDLNTLSDGFSSAIHIVTELMMRMEKQRSRFYDMQGLVLIDEIETHLHIDLQKKILPFLTRFFPKIQFIVTTHSPFVLTSLKDAVVYDLEHQEAIEDLSGYSVEAIIEGYFSTDKYSQVLKDKVNEYEELMSKSELSEDEEDELKSLEKYFDDLSMVFADELKLKLEQIKLLNPVR